MLAAVLLAVLCGIERRDAKVLRDAGAGALLPVRRATVHDLISLRAPRLSKWAARHRLERLVVQLDVEVLAYKTEEDGDVHAIIRGGRDVMVAELPLPICTWQSPYERQMNSARAAFQRLMRLHVQRVRITGVVFFDKQHGQLGGAWNGVELHPVLAVKAMGDKDSQEELKGEGEGTDEGARGE